MRSHYFFRLDRITYYQVIIFYIDVDSHRLTGSDGVVLDDIFHQQLQSQGWKHSVRIIIGDEAFTADTVSQSHFMQEEIGFHKIQFFI